MNRAVNYSETSCFELISNNTDFPEKRFQITDYQSALNRCVKPTLRIVYDQLMENLSGLDGEIINSAMIDDLLSIFYSALAAWEQIDEKIKKIEGT